MGLVLRHLVSSQFRHLPLQLVTFTEQGPDGATRYSERAEQDKGADIHSCSCRRLRRLAVGLRLAAPLLLRVAAVHIVLGLPPTGSQGCRGAAAEMRSGSVLCSARLRAEALEAINVDVWHGHSPKMSTIRVFDRHFGWTHVVESSPPLERVRESIPAVARSLGTIFACLESLRRCRASR